jgi:hypothetical protein
MGLSKLAIQKQKKESQKIEVINQRARARKKKSSCKNNETLTEQLDASVPFVAVVVVVVSIA